MTIPFLLLGCVFLFAFMSVSCGWSGLAERFEDVETELRGHRGLLHSGAMDWLWLGGCLITGAGAHGLQLRMIPPLRPWFPNLLIPWDEIEDHGKTGLLRSSLFRLGGSVTFTAGFDLGPRIRTALAVHGPARDRSTPLTPQLIARDALHRCPYCHDALETGQVEVCAHCHTAQHTDCLREHGGCVVHACPGVRSLVPVA